MYAKYEECPMYDVFFQGCVKRVQLIWSSREKGPSLVQNWFPGVFESLAGLLSNVDISVVIYSTSREKEKKSEIELSELNSGQNGSSQIVSRSNTENEAVDDLADQEGGLPSILNFHSGRPDLDSILKETATKVKASENCAMLACGPARMVAAAQSKAAANGFAFHKETFLL